MRRAIMLMALSLAALPGCDPCACVNDCGRSYALGEGPAAVQIQNRHEAGKDCEIDSIARSIPDGLTTVIGKVTRRDPMLPDGFSYAIDVTASFAGDVRAARCEGLPQFGSIDELSHALLDPGTALCVVDRIASKVLCTQIGCASP